MGKLCIISLGGSLIIPENIDVEFLRGFKSVIEKFLKKGYNFVIYCGGGKIARNYQNAVSSIIKTDNDDLDWIGIQATRLNAELLRIVFKGNSKEAVHIDPNSGVDFNGGIVVAAGWKPGNSTDYDAVIVARNLGVKEIINMSNVDYVYDRDPKKFSDASRIGSISWKKMLELIGTKWKPGMNVPFDPIAAKEAEKAGIRIKIIGADLKNLENALEGKDFKGTVIE